MFVVIEGVDGSGKTTLAKEVVRRLESLGIKAKYTYEPYNQLFVEIMSKYWSELDPLLQTLIMALDRYYHVRKEVIPYLNAGYVVVCDRYYYSSLAYQGAQGVDVEWIISVNKFVPKPNLAIYLDVDPEEGLRRKERSTTRIKELEADLNIIKRARDIYLELVKQGELILIDAMRAFELVFNDVFNLILRYSNIKA